MLPRGVFRPSGPGVGPQAPAGLMGGAVGSTVPVTDGLKRRPG
ncbi:hypothetical protein SFR_4573 [Streptomyces sp. FR-008]|nr:hypothetical protein SFR_4573 [Streptomyces sp. FR-008]